MGPDIMAIILIVLIVYILGIGFCIHDRTLRFEHRSTSYEPGEHCFAYHTNAEPSDMWMGVIWPIRLLWLLFWLFLLSCNYVIQYPLLLVGIRYRDTNLDRRIRSFLDRRI